MKNPVQALLSGSLRLLTVTAAVTALVSTAGCGGSNSRHMESFTHAPIAKQELPVHLQSLGKLRTLEQTSFEESWDLDLEIPVHTSWVDDDVPNQWYCQLVTGEVYCVDLISGHTLFVTMPLPALIEHPANVVRTERIGDTDDAMNDSLNDGSTDDNNFQIEYDDRLYVVSESELFCFDAAYGQLIFRHLLPFEPSSGPHAIGTGESLRIFISDWAGRIRVTSTNSENIPIDLWQWNMGGISHSQPTADPILSSLSYVGDSKGVLHAFKPDREEEWSYNAHGSLYAAPLIRGRTLFFGGNDNVFHAVDGLSGKQLGLQFMETPIRRQPFTFNDREDIVYVWTQGVKGGLHAIRAVPDQIEFNMLADKPPLEQERMSKMWFIQGVSRIVAVSDHHLYLMSDRSDIVLAVDRETGLIEWRMNLAEARGEDIQQITEYADRSNTQKTIVTIDHKGHIIAYRIFRHYRLNKK